MSNLELPKNNEYVDFKGGLKLPRRSVTIIPKGTTITKAVTPVASALGTSAGEVGREVLRQHLASQGVKVPPTATSEQLVAAAALQKLQGQKPTLPAAAATTTTVVTTAKPQDQKATISINVAEACRICEESKGQKGGAINHNILRYMIGN